MKSTLSRLVTAITFLTIIPIRWGAIHDNRVETIGSSSIFFPLVGLGLGVIYATVSYELNHYLSRPVIAALIITIDLVLTGALHMDGLADTFDAIGSRKDILGKLNVMKDSSAGPVGVCAIAAILLLKYSLILNLPSRYLVIFPMIGRWAMTVSLYHGTEARKEGLGSLFIRNTGLKESVTAGIVTVITSLVILSPHWLRLIIIIASVYAFVLLFNSLCRRQFGGQTGDNLGAVCGISEVIGLISLYFFKN